MNQDGLRALQHAIDTNSTEHIDQVANAAHAQRNPRTGQLMRDTRRSSQNSGGAGNRRPHRRHDERQTKMFIPPELTDQAARTQYTDTMHALAEIPLPTRSDTAFAGLEDRTHRDDQQ
ncbi:hypothetical protein AXA44_29680 [Rhodococcus sp. SC4]|nr:hypothetical protein AXA44_29680 [Rhodococcus sp. SC4]